MTFDRFPELPTVMKIEIIKKFRQSTPYVRLQQTSRAMDELCEKTKRDLAIHIYHAKNFLRIQSFTANIQYEMTILKDEEDKEKWRILSYDHAPFLPTGFSGEIVRSREQLVRLMLDVIDICQLKAQPKSIAAILRANAENEMIAMTRSQYTIYRNLRESGSVEQLIERTITALRSKDKENSDGRNLVFL